MEDYLKAAYRLKMDGKPATTQLLADELGVAPSAETEALHLELLSAGEAASGALPRDRHVLPTLADRHFVGRDDELAELLAPWTGHRFRVVRLVQLSPLARLERRGPRMPRVDHRRI